MTLFTVIDDQVILRTSRGVYKQAKLALREGHVYAKIPGGFVLLSGNGTTSHPDYRWVGMDTTLAMASGSLGRLIVSPAQKAVTAS